MEFQNLGKIEKIMLKIKLKNFIKMVFIQSIMKFGMNQIEKDRQYFGMGQWKNIFCFTNIHT